jgi:VCBS repeat protein
MRRPHPAIPQHRLAWLVAVVALALVILLITASAARGVTFDPPVHYPAGFSPNAVAIADLNADGKRDIAVVNEGGSVSILLGNGDGTFAGPTNFPVGGSGRSPFSIAIADFNEDEAQDLAVGVVGGSTAGVSILLGNGNGTFGAATHYPGAEGFSVAAADLNGDTHVDVAATFGTVINVFAGDGSGTLAAPVGYPAGGRSSRVAAGDLNGDSRPDLVDSNQDPSGFDRRLAVMLADGAGGFGAPVNYSLGENFRTPTFGLGDVNGDSKLDAVVPGNVNGSTGKQNLYVLLGDGAGGLGAPTAFPATPQVYLPTVADLSGDGKADIAVLDQDRDAAGVLLGDGSGTFFTPSTSFRTHDTDFTSLGMAVADLDGDSRPDIALSSRGFDDLSVLLNRTGTYYPRPKGATPLRASLVPAYSQCTSPNRTHGAPLAYGSCFSDPPNRPSTLSIGTPDANGAAANSVGFVQAKVRANATDVELTTSITDVRCTPSFPSACGSSNNMAGADYVGELQVSVGLRITDRLVTAGGYDPDRGTVQDTTFPVTVTCAGTSSHLVGSTCARTTTANAVVPGAVVPNARSVWELGQVQVFDGGEDGDVDTPDGNHLFMVQGVFVP